MPILSSSWRLTSSLEDYLIKQGLIAIFGIDTRKLTKILRTKGSQNGCIIAGKSLETKKAYSIYNR